MKAKMKLKKLWSYLLCLLMVAGFIMPAMPVNIFAAATNGYITEIILDNVYTNFQEHIKGSSAYNSVRYTLPSDAKYLVTQKKILQNGKELNGSYDIMKPGEATPPPSPRQVARNEVRESVVPFVSGGSVGGWGGSAGARGGGVRVVGALG